MKRTSCALVAAFALLPLSGFVAQAEDGIPVSVRRLSDRAIVLWCTHRPETSNIVALSSQRGIVVVDTEMSPSLARAVRARIVSELGRDDFAYIINTHDHWDHTSGNPAFADAVIIGHENCPAGMEAVAASAERRIGGLGQYIQRMRSGLDELEEGSEAYVARCNAISYFETVLRDMEEHYETATPWLTFSDKMKLDLGDMTLDLTFYGIAHSRSDIVIHCPEEGLLITGDLFHPSNNPYIDSERVRYLPRWIEILQWATNPGTEISHVIPGHGEFLSRELLQRKLDFVLAESAKYAGRQSAFELFKRIYEEAGMLEAVARLDEQFSKPDEYFFIPDEFDAFGLRMATREGDAGTALVLLKWLAEKYPEAWTSFDSLGEAYLVLGENELAIASFRRSLELNPDNRNAAQRLAQLGAEQQ